jgi:hypothetical protein
MFQKELYNCIPSVTVWRVLRKRLRLKVYKLSIVQHVQHLEYHCKLFLEHLYMQIDVPEFCRALVGSVCACEVFIRATPLYFCIISESHTPCGLICIESEAQHFNTIMVQDDIATGPPCNIDIPRTIMAFCFVN